MLPVSATLSRDDPQGQAGERAMGRELIRKSRDAVAASNVRQQLTGISASGKLRRFAKYVSVQSPTKVEQKERILNGKVQFDFVLPDRFRRRITNTNLSGVRYTYTEVVNGELAWRHPPPPIVSSRGDQRVIDVDDVERSQLKYAHDARQNLAFYTIGWLLEPPAEFPLDFIYAGRVRDEDRVDEAVIVEAPNGFRPVLLIDTQTYLPSGWVIAYVEPRRIPVIVEVASVSRHYISETVLRARREREARRVPPSRRELVWRFLDHEEIGGMRLPRRVTTRLDGEILEELWISEFRINPSIDSKKFEGRPEVR